MNDIANLSVDLRRISNWLQSGNFDLARKFLVRDIEHYGSLQIDVGKMRLKRMLEMMLDLDGGREKAAERAMTASIILMHRAGKA